MTARIWVFGRKEMITKGIDVSVWQGKIDWERVKRQGVDFAIIKAGQGKSVSGDARYFADSRFEYNLTTAHECGIALGAYYYVTACNIDEAKREAEHFVSLISPHKSKITLWAVLDVEDVSPPKYCGLTKPCELTDIVLEMARLIKNAGFEVMLYTNRTYIENRLEFSRLSHLPLWRAHWKNGHAEPSDAPGDYSENMKIWQWGSEKIDGISGDVDSNYGYFDIRCGAGGTLPRVKSRVQGFASLARQLLGLRAEKK